MKVISKRIMLASVLLLLMGNMMIAFGTSAITNENPMEQNDPKTSSPIIAIRINDKHPMSGWARMSTMYNFIYFDSIAWEYVIDGEMFRQQYPNGYFRDIQIANSHTHNFVIRDCDVRNGYYGIHIYGSAKGRLENNHISDIIRQYNPYPYGIWMDGGHTIEIIGNTITGAYRGISISGNTVNVTGNIVTGNTVGVYLDGAFNNIISDNYITQNLHHGIQLANAHDNEITGNEILDNSWDGLRITDNSYSNTVWHNKLAGNRRNAYDLSGFLYNYDLNGIGNYWGDYTGIDENGDGIGDTPYYILTWKQDNFPLMDYPYEPPTQITELLEELLDEVSGSDLEVWANPSYNRHNTMMEKIGECIDLWDEGNAEECYSKLLHDIKPKLTGLKEDEGENTFGNGVFNNPWVINSDWQQHFAEMIDEILILLEGDQVI